MSEECLICGKPLEYIQPSKEMKCSICGKKSISEARCVDGHFVCDKCHSKGIPLIKEICLNTKSKNPYYIQNKIMYKDFIHMHGPEHHVLTGASLLTAYKNSGGDIDLEKSLIEMEKRGREVPGGICGFWGTCGAAISLGIFISIISKATPLTNKSWGQSNLATSEALKKIGEIGGPRCCKRNSYIAIETAINYTKENFNIEMEKEEIICHFSKKNNQCIKTRCPYYFNNEYKKS